MTEERVWTLPAIAREIGMLPETLKYRLRRDCLDVSPAIECGRAYYNIDDVKVILWYFKNEYTDKLDVINKALRKLN